ncbi:MAG: amino acid ABC transporter permease [Leptolyngbyaceae cyanobacterium]
MPTAVQWLRKHLFNGWWNSLLTLVCAWFILGAIGNFLGWITTQAQWNVVSQNLRLFLVGRYPADQSWRLWLVLAIGGGTTAFWLWSTFTKQAQLKQRLRLVPLIGYPLAYLLCLWLIGGGLGLPIVRTSFWNGLLLTLLAAMTSVVLAFPLGVLLALGRQSDLPVLRGVSTLYIELMRGLPLIGILFMAQVMLPLILPGQMRPDRVGRAIAGLLLFNAAYLAETVRGGLQTIPRGQVEAAKALGLNPIQQLRLIILPQALQVVIPAIVGQFISLFKDTSLLALFALLELTGISRTILAQPSYLGRYAEVYLFVGLLYWIFCYSMSQISRRLERQQL